MTNQDEPFFVVGLATRTTNAAESDPATALLPGLWERSSREPYLVDQRRRDDVVTVAVLTDYESDADGAYTEVVGIRAASVTELPEGLVAVSVPAQARHHVAARGAMPDALIAAWRRVWQQTESGELLRAYATDYEVHGPDGADLYLSVREP